MKKRERKGRNSLVWTAFQKMEKTAKEERTITEQVDTLAEMFHLGKATVWRIIKLKRSLINKINQN